MCRGDRHRLSIFSATGAVTGSLARRRMSSSCENLSPTMRARGASLSTKWRLVHWAGRNPSRNAARKTASLNAWRKQAAQHCSLPSSGWLSKRQCAVAKSPRCCGPTWTLIVVSHTYHRQRTATPVTYPCLRALYRYFRRWKTREITPRIHLMAMKRTQPVYLRFVATQLLGPSSAPWRAPARHTSKSAGWPERSPIISF